MPLINTIHESLPYIDAEPTPAERAAAQSLIDSELSPNATTTTHPLLPPLSEPNFSPLIQLEHTRISGKEPLKAIDLSRYEAVESSSPTISLLQQAYTTTTHLSTRNTNLALLSTYGKNAWLIGNSQLEDLLRGIEKELKDTKEEIDHVVIERKNMQEGASGEIKGLEEGWKRGVGRVLETEVAAEGVRLKVLERRREGAF